MSFILQALNKKQIDDNHQLAPEVNSTQSNSKFRYILLGSLFTFVMVIAVLLGYWIGQGHNPQMPTIAPKKVNTVSNVVANTEISENKTMVNHAATLTQDVNKKTAELGQYFDDPSQYYLKKTQSTPKSQHRVLTKVKKRTNKKSLVISSTKTVQPLKKLAPTLGVSNELLAKFNSAIEATQPTNQTNSSTTVQQSETKPATKMQTKKVNTKYKDVQALASLPESIQQSLPTLHFSMHIFASNGEGWVRVNNHDYYEGDIIENSVELVSIQPQKVILNYQQHRFYMPALSNWH